MFIKSMEGIGRSHGYIREENQIKDKEEKRCLIPLDMKVRVGM